MEGWGKGKDQSSKRNMAVHKELWHGTHNLNKMNIGLPKGTCSLQRGTSNLLRHQQTALGNPGTRAYREGEVPRETSIKTPVKRSIAEEHGSRKCSSNPWLTSSSRQSSKEAVRL